MSTYYMPCTVLSSGGSWVNERHDHSPYGYKKRRWEEYRNQKVPPIQQTKNPISFKVRVQLSVELVEFVQDCTGLLLLL